MRKIKPSPEVPAQSAAPTATAAPEPQIPAPAPVATAKTKPRAVFNPSSDLAGVIGPEPVTRPDALGKLWDYIRKNKLQSSEDKRNIQPDAKLKPVLGDSKVSMFKFAGLIAKHLSR